MRVDGRCHCGAIAFEAEVDPKSVRICHWSDCQSMSGSLFRANIQASAEGFQGDGHERGNRLTARDRVFIAAGGSLHIRSRFRMGLWARSRSLDRSLRTNFYF